MLFNSLEYLIFFSLIVVIYYALPHKYRWILLLGGSYYFYMSWRVEYIVLIIISTLIDYGSAIGINKSKKPIHKKWFLAFSLASNLGLLIAFKYANFISDNINALFTFFGITEHLTSTRWLLPVGISFYTFQTMSYTIDVYRAKIKPEMHLGKFALYVTFFPQLVAGPIERAVELIPELKKKVLFDKVAIVSGLRRILWGLFKKIVVADRAALLVNHVYGEYENQNGLSLLLATYFFAIQIYCDFSGYSDIAIGSSRILGIRLMENFKMPYFSSSITEFWSRWHISLSTWFRDYVYIPLGGNRLRLQLTLFNILIVFLISGFWHGANWTFVVWGGLHGLLLVGEKLLKIDTRNPLSSDSAFTSFWKGMLCFHGVLITWIFFRSDSVGMSLQIIRNIADLSSWHFNISYLSPQIGNLPMITLPKFLTTLIFIFLMLGVEYGLFKGYLKELFFSQKTWIRWSVYYAVIVVIVLFGYHGQIDFIYFQF